ncbi:MAG: hypothetical protein MK109_09465, partial [Dehalococcoidia bacterium]|nr:hypothetical protein [Dehalococcoidia bacterium]
NRLFKPLPDLLTGISGGLPCSVCSIRVHPDYEVGLAACAWPTGSWRHAGSLFLAMPKINRQVAMKA